jgi:hypothetical protein
MTMREERKCDKSKKRIWENRKGVWDKDTKESFSLEFQCLFSACF